MVELQDVSKVYTLGTNKIYALNKVNVSVNKGEFLAIMGPSGSGKSTLLNMIGCLDLPTEGAIKVNSRDFSKLSDDELTVIRKNNIGFIFQHFNLIQSLSAIENIEMPMIFNKVSATERRLKALYLLERANLELKYANHKPKELSGGQQQRVAIARALANDPPVLLADEPTGNLDSISGKSIMELLKDLNENGTTVIVVTHDKEISEYSHRVIELRDGKVC